MNVGLNAPAAYIPDSMPRVHWTGQKFTEDSDQVLTIAVTPG